VLFVYWGRRGLTRLALEIARVTRGDPSIAATFSISRQNERFAEFTPLGDALVPVDTFARDAGALLHAWRIGVIRRQLLQHIAAHRPHALIELMPHVWSSFVMPAVKSAGVRYAAVAHDAEAHPGDRRSAYAAWLLGRTVRQADLLLTLSSHVAERIRAQNLVPAGRIRTLFLPDVGQGNRTTAQPPLPGQPWRLMFLGRILPYKGLDLFLDTVEELQRRGIAVEVGVFGEGTLGPHAARLAALGAEVVNRWMTDAEIDAQLRRFHTLVLSHTEASQSGLVALALGAGLPVVATPVGGLVEQVTDGVTGILAARADTTALADATARLLSDPAFYSRICTNLLATSQSRSVRRFIERCVQIALSG
jgi:glycosyltransferase involved in cell wall biosynthesis